MARDRTTPTIEDLIACLPRERRPTPIADVSKERPIVGDAWVREGDHGSRIRDNERDKPNIAYRTERDAYIEAQWTLLDEFIHDMKRCMSDTDRYAPAAGVQNGN